MTVAIVYAVRSKRQWYAKKGQSFISPNLASAVSQATFRAQRQKQRMYVVIVRVDTDDSLVT